MKGMRTMTAVALLALLGTGCATKKFVRGEVGAAEGRTDEKRAGDIGEVSSQIERNQTRLSEHETQMGEISATAQDALDRAIAAGQLAEGRFLYETLLSDDKVHFGFNRAELSEEAQVALDGFAAEIQARNEDVFIEIQGHTDSVGDEAYNLKLGEARAETVRRYLSMTHGFALHRMSVISYGESAPIDDNGTREGRARNRRVVLVVLK